MSGSPSQEIYPWQRYLERLYTLVPTTTFHPAASGRCHRETKPSVSWGTNTHIESEALVEITQAFGDRAEVQAQVSLTPEHRLSVNDVLFMLHILAKMISLEEEKEHYPQFCPNIATASHRCVFFHFSISPKCSVHPVL